MNLVRNSKGMQNMHFHQRGALLVVGLIMVLLMAIVGMAAIRGTGLQESMAGNMRVRNIAFQAAESGLRAGETIVSPANKFLPVFDCTAGECPDQNILPQNSIIYWSNTKWDQLAAKSTFSVDDISAPPLYVIEELQIDMGASAAAEGSAIDVAGMQTTGDATPYRVSAKGTGISAEADSVVQSTFKRRFQ